MLETSSSVWKTEVIPIYEFRLQTYFTLLYRDCQHKMVGYRGIEPRQ